MGYPGMNWSVVVRVPERELLAVTGLAAPAARRAACSSRPLVLRAGRRLADRAPRGAPGDGARRGRGARSRPATSPPPWRARRRRGGRRRRRVAAVARAFERVRRTTQALVDETGGSRRGRRRALDVRGDTDSLRRRVPRGGGGTNRTLEASSR
jgi:hypothetical protein